jgi:hypothetical protein
MQFAIDLIQKIPAGWPRLATLGAIVAAYFFFPNIVKKLAGSQKEKETLERMMQFLQVKKLLLELEALQKEKHLSGFEFPGEERLLAELKDAGVAQQKATEKPSYLRRLQYSLLGAAIFFLIAALVFALSRSHEPASAAERRPADCWLPSYRW